MWRRFWRSFGGSAALSLALKPKKGRLDIYNDVDNDLFNVFCCIKENQHALARELRFLPVHGREPFQLYRNIAAHEADYFKHIEEEKLGPSGPRLLHAGTGGRAVEGAE